MDKVYHFQTQKGRVGHLKSVISAEQKLQFYSEEEYDSSTDNTPGVVTKNNTKPGLQLTQLNSSQGYQTDDGGSEAGTPKASKGLNNKTAQVKKSKFRNLVNTKQIEGDVENEPDFGGDHDIKRQEEKKTPDTEDMYNIEQQIKKIEQKMQDNPMHKLHKNKNTMSQQHIHVNSDNEKVKNKNSQGDKLASHPFRHLIFGRTINETSFKKFLILTQRGLIYSQKCLKGPSEKFIKSKQVVLPEAQVKKDKTLVLDLDETLIHSCPPRDNPQVYVTAVGDYGEEAKVIKFFIPLIQIGFNVRPYCSLFLQKLSNLYTIYIYTASSAAYANAIIKYLDPKGQYITGILTRSNCMETKNGFFIKDLRIIANKQLKDMLIVDNLAHSFGFQLENGIPILEYHNDQNDAELKYLISYLEEAAKSDDLREYNKRLKLHDLIEFNLED